jgi:hypothetical protein
VRQRRAYLHDDDVVMVFAAEQQARHAAMLQANEVARRLTDVQRARNASQQPDEDGELPEPGCLRVIVGFHREDITTKQRGFLHAAVLRQIAEQVRMPDGTRYTAEVWKEFFRQRFLGHQYVLKATPRWDSEAGRMVIPKRATPVRERISTESLGIKGYSAFIDQVIAAATTELGVVFEFDQQEREAVRYRRPQRRPAVARPREKRMGAAVEVQPLALPAPEAVEA